MARAGRFAEFIVEAIEKHLAGATVERTQSPGHLVDSVTSEQREFDVLLHQKVGHHDVVVAIEVRDRSRKVGTPEMEAFIEKAKDCGAHVRAFCSKKGFTSGALKKATKNHVRCLELRVRDNLPWITGKAEMQFQRSGLRRLDFRPCAAQVGVDCVTVTVDQAHERLRGLVRLPEPPVFGSFCLRVRLHPPVYVIGGPFLEKLLVDAAFLEFAVEALPGTGGMYEYVDAISGESLSDLLIQYWDDGGARFYLYIVGKADGEKSCYVQVWDLPKVTGKRTRRRTSRSRTASG